MRRHKRPAYLGYVRGAEKKRHVIALRNRATPTIASRYPICALSDVNAYGYPTGEQAGS